MRHPSTRRPTVPLNHLSTVLDAGWARPTMTAAWLVMGLAPRAQAPLDGPPVGAGGPSAADGHPAKPSTHEDDNLSRGRRDDVLNEEEVVQPVACEPPSDAELPSLLDVGPMPRPVDSNDRRDGPAHALK